MGALDITAILAATLAMAAPLLYASLGELLSQRSGILNLGLEGTMLIGAITGYMTGMYTHSLWLGVLVALAAGAFVGLMYAFLTVTMQANQTVCGLALVTVGTGISGFLGKAVYGHTSDVVFSKITIPGLSQIPVIGPIFFDQNILVYILYIIVPVMTFYIFKTRPGLTLRALGENPAALDAVGFHVYALRYIHVIIGSALVSLGGAYVTLAYTPNWNTGMTAGKGWIAAALVIFSGWKPVNALLGAILFGGVEVLGLRLQLIETIHIPSYFFKMLPYICTVVVLIFSTGSFRKSKSPAPAALGLHYDREDR